MAAETPSGLRAGRKGRPTPQEAEQLTDEVLDQATRLFMERGFGATTVEAISAAAGVSKRTFYTRYPGKAEVFEAVVLRYVRRHVRSSDDIVPAGASLEEQLCQMGLHLLQWILQEDVLALYRITVAEAQRFPELARIVSGYAIEDALRALESLFRQNAPGLPAEEIRFVAEQFMQSIAAGPFHRAVQGVAPPGLNERERSKVHAAVSLFLRGWARQAG